MHLDQTIEMTNPCLVRHMIDGYVLYEFEETFDHSFNDILSKKQKEDICEFALKNEKLHESFTESYLYSNDGRPLHPEKSEKTLKNSNEHITTNICQASLVDVHNDNFNLTKKKSKIVCELEKVQVTSGNKDAYLDSFENKVYPNKNSRKPKKKNFSPLRIQAISPKKKLKKEVLLSNHLQTLEMYKECLYELNNSYSSNKKKSVPSNNVPCCSKSLKKSNNKLKIENNQIKRLSSFLTDYSCKNTKNKLQPVVNVTKETEKVDQLIPKIISNKEVCRVNSNKSCLKVMNGLNAATISKTAINESEDNSITTFHTDLEGNASIQEHVDKFNDNLFLNESKQISFSKTLKCANKIQLEEYLDPECEYESSTSTCQPILNNNCSPLSEWSVEQLHLYFYSLKDFEITADKLKYEEIDGHVMRGMLLELDVKQFADEMNIKLGDAIRIFGRLNALNTNMGS